MILGRTVSLIYSPSFLNAGSTVSPINLPIIPNATPNFSLRYEPSFINAGNTIPLINFPIVLSAGMSVDVIKPLAMPNATPSFSATYDPNSFSFGKMVSLIYSPSFLSAGSTVPITNDPMIIKAAFNLLNIYEPSFINAGNTVSLINPPSFISAGSTFSLIILANNLIVGTTFVITNVDKMPNTHTSFSFIADATFRMCGAILTSNPDRVSSTMATVFMTAVIVTMAVSLAPIPPVSAVNAFWMFCIMRRVPSIAGDRLSLRRDAKSITFGIVAVIQSANLRTYGARAFPSVIETPSNADLSSAIDPDSVSSCWVAIVSAVPPASDSAASRSRMPSVLSVSASIAGAASTPNSFMAPAVSIPASFSVSRMSAKSRVVGSTSSSVSPIVSSWVTIAAVGFSNRENAPRNAVPACSPLKPALYRLPRMALTSSISIPIDFATGPTYLSEYSRASTVALLLPIVFAKTSAIRALLSIPRPNCPSVEVTTSVVFVRSVCVAAARSMMGLSSPLVMLATS